MNIHLLGPIEASIDGRPVTLGAPQQRAVLAMLALQVNHAVSADRLIDGLWGEQAPATAPKMVQLYVSQLRKLLRGNGGEIVTRGRGYELRLATDRVDVAQFERLVAEAMRADGAVNGEAREALALWRGSPLADVADEPFASAEIRRLEELRLQAAELAIDADLAAGRHLDVLSELRSLISDEPLRERLRAQLMLALYRSGRQADALEAYRHTRTALVEAIGVEPGPELRRLHEAILRQDPKLEPERAIEAVPSPSDLDVATPLVGREAELEWLRRHWRRALGGAGRLVLVAGERGIGKTRLAAELAAEVTRDGGTVEYLSASGSPEGVHDKVADALSANSPLLLVLDDVHLISRELEVIGERLAALEERPVLVVATAERLLPAARLRATDTLLLEPLKADGVRALADLYVGGAGTVAAPVEHLLAASGGLPERLHGAASEWARTLEARRLGESVRRIAADRPVLRAAEDDVVGSIIKLQAARERSERMIGAAADGTVCPFKGLAAFEAEDAKFFFGRERLVAEMVARVTGSPLTGIVGPSGSGKSSALRAGLLAALSAGVLPGSERWALVLLRPGEHPLRALEHAIASAPKQGRLVVAVDQFEETFTSCREDSERAEFIDALLARTRDPRRRTLVVVAVRSDYYGRCAGYPELSRLLGAGHVLVGPMRDSELRRAIELPAGRVGVQPESALIDALVADVEGRPGALPLLSTSLLELWQSRDGRHLRADAYHRAGGVSGAVARMAETAYERLEPGRRAIARRILLRLAGEGEGEAIVRRRVPLSELDADRDEGVSEVLQVLADDRLVTIGEGEVEVAHEALLREWPRLRGWLEEDAEGRRLHQHLIHAATDWDSAARDAGELYRGARLVSALEWIDGHEPELNTLEREFLAESRAAAQLEGERQRRANRRLRSMLAVVAVMLALAVVAGAVALTQRGAARDSAVAADAQRLGAEALTREPIDLALLLAVAGVDLHDSAPTRSNLLSVLQRSQAMLGLLPADGWPMFAMAVSSDGRLAAVGSERGTVTVFDTATRRRIGTPYQMREGPVSELRFSPDGKTLAVTGQEPQTPGGLVDLIDPRTGERRRRVVLPRSPEPADSIVVFAEFGPDGRELVAEQIHDLTDPGAPATVLHRIDVESGVRRGSPLRLGRHSAQGITATADHRRLFVTSPVDDRTYEIDAKRLRIIRRFPVGDFAGSVSPDARSFALGSSEGGVRLLDLRSGRVRRLEGGHDARILRMTFTPDGRTLVTAAEDGTLIVWDVARGEPREALAGHPGGPLWGLQVAPDGRSAYTAGFDGRAVIWDLAPDRRLDRTFDAGPPFVTDDGDEYPRGLALSPDGRVLAVTQVDGTVDMLDAHTLRRRTTVAALRGFAAAVAFSPDGRLLAVTGRGGRLALFDARTLRPEGELNGLASTSQAIAFSPDGKLLAAAALGTLDEAGSSVYSDSDVRIWDVKRRRLTGVHFRVTSASIAFSPDGRLLATGSLGRDGAEIHDLRDGRLVARLPNDDRVRSVAFAPDGGSLATGQLNGQGQLWSTGSWKRIGHPLEGHRGRLLELEFTRDGSVLATAGADGTVALWDVHTQQRLGAPVTVEPDAFVATAFTPDDSRLFAVSGDRRALRWEVSVDAWRRQACRVAGRELTAREWQVALPDRPYRAVCAP